jgi:hypothetical protein
MVLQDYNGVLCPLHTKEALLHIYCLSAHVLEILRITRYVFPTLTTRYEHIQKTNWLKKLSGDHLLDGQHVGAMVQ